MSTIKFEDFEREFSTSEKLRAFLYHCYIVTVGSFLEPEKHDNYLDTFQNFKKYRAAKESEAKES